MIRFTLTAAVTVALCFVPVYESRAGDAVVDWLAEFRGERGELKQIQANAIIQGAGSALEWANSSLKTDGKKQLFCPPAKLALNFNNYRQIVLDEYELKKDVWNKLGQEYGPSIIVYALLSGLRRTFPCE